MSEAPTPASEPLSFDDAVASIAGPEPEEHIEAEEGAAEQPPEPEEPEAESSPPDDAGEADEPGDSEPEETETEAAADPLKAPQYWTNEEKDQFAKLDRDTQEILLRQETKRETVTQKAKQKADEAAKAAQTEIAKVQQVATALDQWIPKAVQAFRDKWTGVDQPGYWKAVRDQYGADYERDLRDAHEYDMTLLRQTAAAQQETNRIQREARQREIEAAIPEQAPALADPKDGKQRWTKTVDWLVGLGADRNEIQNMGAVERGLAYDAMRWRETQAAANKAPQPRKPQAPAARTVARPAAAQPGSSPQRTTQALADRFSKSLSVDDAVALLASKG